MTAPRFTAQGWQDIATAPRDGTVVLVWGCDEEEWEDARDEPCEPRFYAFPAYVSVQQQIWWLAGGGLRQIEGVTHWMPLPDAPTPSPSVTREGGE